MNRETIKKKSDLKSLKRSKKISADLDEKRTKDNAVYYTVRSSQGDKQYRVIIQLLDLSSDKVNSFDDALEGNLRIFCSCPNFAYRLKYVSDKAGVGLDKEIRPPNITNPERKGMACKHILAALEKMRDSDKDKIRSLFKNSAPKKPQQDPKYNKDSEIPTEEDLTIIDNFKSACHNLYNDLTKYLESEELRGNKKIDSQKFKSSQFFKGSDPSQLLLNLSKPAKVSVKKGKVINDLTSLDRIIHQMSIYGNGFNTVLDDDIKKLTNDINKTIAVKTESLINDIIFRLIGD